MSKESDSVKKKKSLTIRQKGALAGYVFILPWIMGFFIFTAFPFFYSIFISLSNVRITPSGIETTWAGLLNYINIFTKEVNFPTALIGTLVFVVLSVPMIVVVSLIIAILLNGKFRGRAVFRAIFFLPVIIISGPVINELLGNYALNFVDPSKYIVYKFFQTLPGVVGTPVLSVFNNITMILWFSGVQILIFLAGLQKIDTSIYEAAQIDGASSWEVFWKIVLPYLKPMALVNGIYTIVEIASFPNNPVNIEITKKMFQTGTIYSYSAAMSWVYFLAELILLGIVFLLLKDKNVERKKL